MTVAEQGVRLPPRGFVRVFWVLHRALYRISGGRFGLAEPKPGGRFGMMRVHTVGRRSGKARTTMVGYYLDGSNLVTIAMNGWAKADPDWWRNLQAHPEATVDLVDGPRDVRARVAVGEERDRLWRGLREYRGWGDDLDALAARRDKQTAVVVLEPRRSVSTGSTGG
jgi:deazaflavin-dependent oxidoreductase (nitroreductase family)